MIFFRAVFLLLLVFFISPHGLYGCGPEIKKEPIEEITIFCPENFAEAIIEMRPVFTKAHPHHTIYAPEASDLENIYNITRSGKTPDVLILSDDSLIDKLIASHIDWYITAAYDRIVLAFNKKSKYYSIITAGNWYEVISRKDVNLGRADERVSPLGYRTLMALKLAEGYYRRDLSGLYKNFSPRNIFATHKELDFLLMAGDLDYIFDYLSAAERHNLKYIILPPQIDLGSKEFEKEYALVKFTTGKSEFAGRPIRYIVTIPNSVEYPQRGMKFLEVMFSEEGRQALKKYKIQCVEPSLQVLKTSAEIPEALKGLMAGEEKDE